MQNIIKKDILEGKTLTKREIKQLIKDEAKRVTPQVKELYKWEKTIYEKLDNFDNELNTIESWGNTSINKNNIKSTAGFTRQQMVHFIETNGHNGKYAKRLYVYRESKGLWDYVNITEAMWPDSYRDRLKLSLSDAPKWYTSLVESKFKEFKKKIGAPETFLVYKNLKSGIGYGYDCLYQSSDDADVERYIKKKKELIDKGFEIFDKFSSYKAINWDRVALRLVSEEFKRRHKIHTGYRLTTRQRDKQQRINNYAYGSKEYNLIKRMKKIKEDHNYELNRILKKIMFDDENISPLNSSIKSELTYKLRKALLRIKQTKEVDNE